MSMAMEGEAVGTASFLQKIPNTGVPKEDIEAFCRRWYVTELYAFGTVVSEEFGLDIPLGVTIRFEPQANKSLLTVVRMEEELEDIFGIHVVITYRDVIRRDSNSIRREEILGGLEKIYEA